MVWHMLESLWLGLLSSHSLALSSQQLQTVWRLKEVEARDVIQMYAAERSDEEEAECNQP